MRRIRHQDVDAAELLTRVVDERATEFLVGQIARQQHTAPALRLDGALGLLGIRLFRVQVIDRDVGTLARKQHSHRAPDAGIPPVINARLSFSLPGAGTVLLHAAIECNLATTHVIEARKAHWAYALLPMTS
jgi:hypothetical protein